MKPRTCLIWRTVKYGTSPYADFHEISTWFLLGFLLFPRCDLSVILVGISVVISVWFQKGSREVLKGLWCCHSPNASANITGLSSLPCPVKEASSFKMPHSHPWFKMAPTCPSDPLISRYLVQRYATGIIMNLSRHTFIQSVNFKTQRKADWLLRQSNIISGLDTNVCRLFH